MRYFFKHVASTPLYLPGGSHFPFDTVPDANGRDSHPDGIWKTDDPFLISEAEKAIRSGVGGIEEITAEKYDDLAKKKLGGPSPRSWLSDSRPAMPLQVLPAFNSPQPVLPPVGPSVVPHVVGQGETSPTGVKPIEVPKATAFKKPRTALRGKEA